MKYIQNLIYIFIKDPKTSVTSCYTNNSMGKERPNISEGERNGILNGTCYITSTDSTQQALPCEIMS